METKSGTGKNKLYPVVPTWEGQEDLIKKLQADLEEATKLNKELRDQVKSS